MVYWSMRTDLRMANELSIKRKVVAIGGCPFLLYLLIFIYTKAIDNFKTALNVVLL